MGGEEVLNDRAPRKKLPALKREFFGVKNVLTNLNPPSPIRG